MMIGQQKKDITPLAVRKAILLDSDKVRYRVYRTPTEFVAVIAESALMAIKVSGIENPHRIVRDLPTTQLSIDAERMLKHDPAQTEKQTFRTETQPHDTGPIKIKLAEAKKAEPFAAMTLEDFRMVWEKKHPPTQEAPPPAAEAEVVVQQQEPTPEIAEPTEHPPVAEETPIAAQPPEPQTEMQASETVESKELSPEEIEKLLS